jgi:hypothetical protein
VTITGEWNDMQNAIQNENIVPIKHTCVTHGMDEQKRATN